MNKDEKHRTGENKQEVKLTRETLSIRWIKRPVQQGSDYNEKWFKFPGLRNRVIDYFYKDLKYLKVEHIGFHCCLSWRRQAF